VQVVVRGFRQMPDDGPNPGQEAGLKLGDVVEEINGEPLGSLAEAVSEEELASDMIRVTCI
jgi:hypothetical protein